MSSANNSENEMSSVEAAHSTTSSYDDEGKAHSSKNGKYCNNVLLDKFKRGNKIAPLWHKC